MDEAKPHPVREASVVISTEGGGGRRLILLERIPGRSHLLRENLKERGFGQQKSLVLLWAADIKYLFRSLRAAFPTGSTIAANWSEPKRLSKCLRETHFWDRNCLRSRLSDFRLSIGICREKELVSQRMPSH